MTRLVLLAAVGYLRGPEPAGAEEADARERPLRSNAHYIAGPEPGISRGEWLRDALDYRARVRATVVPDRRIYDREDLAWAAAAFTCHFTFLYDRSFYDPESGEYRVETFLEDGRREFGGYDAIILWQGYPRLGVDRRNQFDLYRDMPGGLEGLRDVVRRCHDLGVRVFVDYNPWDTGTSREPVSDEEALAELVGALEVDGIFLDTLRGGSERLRGLVDAVRPGVVLAPEIHPEMTELAISSVSWAQWLHDPEPPGILHLKWIEPRHLQYQIRRWDRSHRAEIETAFFNGSGMLVWENIFGTYNPWTSGDRRLWRRASRVLRAHAALFASERWRPFHPTLAEGLHANEWPGEGITLYTLLNRGKPLRDAPLLEVPYREGALCRDIFGGETLRTEHRGDRRILIGSVETIGCVAVATGEGARRFLEARGAVGGDDSPVGEDLRNRARSVEAPRPVERTERAPRDSPPPGMVLVPGGEVRLEIEHMRRECGCYPDPGTPGERHVDFLWGAPHDGRIRHAIGPVKIPPFFIDEAEVSNSEFKRFLDETGYRPRAGRSFLRHWPGGLLPAALEEHPVVHVDLEDARAYARWAGKRLPTEEEWHLAAQGFDGRTWPWGDELDPARCNSAGEGTLPVRSLPEGRSPYGCYHMSGNVWEWTESVRDDGHTRFVMIRGGSYFDAKTSIWYVRGGPQPCGHHAKLLLLWSGLDRCETVGFRCVKDVE